MVALDAMEKAATIRLWQVELNDFLGTVVKVVGAVEDVQQAIAVGQRIAEQMHGDPRGTVIPRLSAGGQQGIRSQVEFNPLIQQNVVKDPRQAAEAKVTSMSTDSVQAQNVQAQNVQAQNVQAQNVQAQNVQAKTFRPWASLRRKASPLSLRRSIRRARRRAWKWSGRKSSAAVMSTIVIRGDVAAVRAAIDAARPKVDGLGKLIAAHVIPRPSDSVLSLLPK
jgi:carbon dioxide concentrating mechanism protein CcmO